jgi:hypothetical protein
VIEHAESLEDLVAEFLSQLMVGVRAVIAKGADEGNGLFIDSPGKELADDVGRNLEYAGGPGDVVEDNDGALLVPRELTKARGADRSRDRLLDLGRTKGPTRGPMHREDLNVPTVGQLDL